MTHKHDIIWYKSIDSTNDEAKRRIHDIDNLSVLSAMSQFAGRGQRGNSWSSAEGENLTFSVVLKFGEEGFPSLPADKSFVLVELTALSVVKLLEMHGINAEIKWPNDIYIGRNKVCGMLVENILGRNGVKSSIIGIGLNINQRNFDVNLPNPTSMLLESLKQKCFTNCSTDVYIDYEKIDINMVLDEFLDIFKGLCQVFLSFEADLSMLRDSYLSKLWRLNETSQFIDYTILPEGHLCTPIVAGIKNDSGSEFTGIIRGLSPIGNLLVEDAVTGTIREFAFKEIGYIL